MTLECDSTTHALGTNSRRDFLKAVAAVAAVAERTIPSPHNGAVVKAASVRLSQVLGLPSWRHSGSRSGA